ncbi:MAG: segregation and condensation protein B [Gammaproteobacteria bacterium]|jgi:segregation and condensation protein B
MNPDQLKNIIEAALLTSDEPRNVNQLHALFEGDDEIPEKEEIKAVLLLLQEDFLDRGVELKEVANGYRFQARADYAVWINRLFRDKPQRYSRAFMETLAIIAYRQPITRSEIEDIRGVSVNTGIIKSLQEREWIRVVGHRDVPGKPELLATTKEFLAYYNLKKLSELPPLSEIKDYDQMNPDLFEGLNLTPANDNPVVDNASPEVIETDESPEDIETDESSLQQEDNVVPFSN